MSAVTWKKAAKRWRERAMRDRERYWRQQDVLRAAGVSVRLAIAGFPDQRDRVTVLPDTETAGEDTKACKTCGGDHWTRDHWAHTTETAEEAGDDFSLPGSFPP